MPGRPNWEGTTPFHGKSDDFSSGYRKRAAGFCRMWKSHEKTKVANWFRRHEKINREKACIWPWKTVDWPWKTWNSHFDFLIIFWHLLEVFSCFAQMLIFRVWISQYFTHVWTLWISQWISTWRFVISLPLNLYLWFPAAWIAVNVWNPLAWTCACPWGRGVPVVMPRSWKLCS